MTSDPEGRKIAKTDVDVCLSGHVRDVLAEAETLLSWLGYGRKYSSLTGETLRPRVREAALHHDNGKADCKWQEHAKGGTLQVVGFRHELESLRRMGEEGTETTPVTAAIASHHGKLSFGHRDRWFHDKRRYRESWEVLEEASDQRAMRADWTDVIRSRYEYDTVRALLRMADQRASQIESSGGAGEDPPLPVRRFQYTFPHSDSGKRDVQTAAERLAETDGLFDALRAETGSGKTAAALLWARKHCRRRDAERVIFALPTRFTSTSLAGDIEETLVQSGLYHSSAWQETGPQRLQMSERFLQPVTVTTVDQVVSCLRGASEQDRVRFANLAHSCLVLDEVDFYDEHVQANLRELFRVLDVLEVPALTMSATFPDSHVSFYAGQFEDAVQPGSDVKIQDMEQQDMEQAEGPPEDLLADACTENKVIIYANTVTRAAEYYDVVGDWGENTVLYHSRFTAADKQRHRRKVTEMLSEGGPGGIAVMTQVGEMSLNVTSGAMVSDLCPVDRLAQRTGRLARYDDRGDLYLIVPEKDGAIYPAPYGSPDPDGGWTPSEKLLQTWALLDPGDVLSKTDLTRLTNRVYGDGVSLSERATENAKTLRTAAANNWLINPEGPPDWKGRDIRPQIDVFVEEPEEEYDTWRAFQRRRLTTSVSVPGYWTDTRSEMLTQKDVMVAGDTIQVTYLSDESQYSPERGLV